MFDYELLLRILLASFCGIIIGYERQANFKVAGVKTHMVVAFSGALIMIVSRYAFVNFRGTFDPGRIAAQFVTGVGFLGAGVIYKRHNNIQGLTTAAGILATASLGLAIGAGMYTVGILGTLLFLLLRVIVQSMETFHSNIQETYYLEVEYEGNAQTALDVCKDKKILSYRMKRLKQGRIGIEVTLIFPDEQSQNEWIQNIVNETSVATFEKY